MNETWIAMGVWRIQIFKRLNGHVEYVFSTDLPFPLNTVSIEPKVLSRALEQPTYEIIEDYLVRRFPAIPVTVVTELNDGTTNEKVMPMRKLT